MVESPFHSTTICAVEKDGKFAMAGDGQVTMGESVVMKGTAKKVRRIYNGDDIDEITTQLVESLVDEDSAIITLFYGEDIQEEQAEALRESLEEKFEGKLNEYNGNLQRAAVELAQEWRTQQSMQKLEAMLIVMNEKEMLLVSGTGEVITPDDGILAIGSGGNFALAAARAMKNYAQNDMSAKEIAENALNIAADICIFTNHNIIVEEL